MDGLLPDLGQRIRSHRLARNLTQREMSERAGLSLRAYQDFEATGKGTLLTLLNVLVVLGKTRDLQNILAETPTYASLDEFVRRQGPSRQRARKQVRQ